MFVSKKSKLKFKRATLPVSVKNRNEYCDFDYVKKLNEEDRQFLKKFSREYYNSDFKHEQKLHNDTKLWYDLNNARNRDLYCTKLVNDELFSMSEETQGYLDNLSFKQFLKEI
jgi:hypothetical protein